mmetsp:Transcript_27043/g.23878  ORF Transcript_27043/g.23878 Transcript_27043/m.23878 type:complete len:84 (+) Transcript_27043:312-563(+)
MEVRDQLIESEINFQIHYIDHHESGYRKYNSKDEFSVVKDGFTPSEHSSKRPIIMENIIEYSERFLNILKTGFSIGDGNPLYY